MGAFKNVHSRSTVGFATVALLVSYWFALPFSLAGEPVDLSKPRVWTAVTGHTLYAVYAGLKDGKVHLILENHQERVVPLDKLSLVDQELLANQKAIVEDPGQKEEKQALIELIAESKRKRLSGEDGVKYYQNLIDTLYGQIPAFIYPKDFIKIDNSFNTKYLKRIEEKIKPISERKNLFTGEYLDTPVYANEPRWQKVSQEIRYNVSDQNIYIAQCDILHAGKDEKKVVYGVWISKNAQSEPCYDAQYREDSKHYFCGLCSRVELTEGGVLAFGKPRDSELKLYSYDSRKDILYSLLILIDRDGRITIRNSDEGSFQFHASSPTRKYRFVYPRDNDGDHWYYNDMKDIALDRYDLSGVPISLDRLWGKKQNYPAMRKPTPLFDNPLNVFAERNIKDK